MMLSKSIVCFLILLPAFELSAKVVEGNLKPPESFKVSNLKFSLEDGERTFLEADFIAPFYTDAKCATLRVVSPSKSLEDIGKIKVSLAKPGSEGEIIKSFDEHCVVFAVASIRPGKYYYQYGNDRDTFKRSRTDFYEPSLANLPEQTIYKGELFMQSKTVLNSSGEEDNKTTVGYQERWAEDKNSLSHICGYCRSNAPQSLDIWHLATDYDVNYAKLNSDFIEENLSDSIDRVLALSDDTSNTPPFVGQFVFKETWIKEMPVYNNAQFLIF